MIEHLFEELSRCRATDGAILTISTEVSDDPLAAFAETSGIGCFRGSLEDVSVRTVDAARRSGAHAFVRLSGDSPLLGPTLVAKAVALFRDEPHDLVTDVWLRTYAKGQSVEVIALSALERAVRDMKSDFERERVTLNSTRIRSCS